MRNVPHSAAVRMVCAPVLAMIALCPLGRAAAESTTVGVEVTFVDSAALGETSALQTSAPGPGSEESVIVATEQTAPSSASAEHTAASLAITTTPGRGITITVESALPGTEYSMTDFRCSYNSARDVPCGGDGFAEVSLASGTLRIGATVSSGGTTEGSVEGGFEVTVSYQ